MSVKMFVPELGTIIILAKPWTFKLINERRNASLAKLTGAKGDGFYYPFGTRDQSDDDVDENYYYSGHRKVPIDPGSYTLPEGTELEVDRIYVRKDARDFSSLSFKTRIKGKMIRFFAKLEDVNEIEL